MSDKVNNQEQPVPKKQISTFWYIIGAAAILMIVYQSGRSSGIRSMLETVERAATAPTAAVPTAAANPQPVNSQPDARHIQRSPRSLETNEASANGGRPANTVPEHLARPASLPPRENPAVRTPAQIGTPDSATTPATTSAASTFDRRSTAPPTGINQSGTKPSETGILSLQPLQPYTAPVPATAPKTLPTPVPVGTTPATVPVLPNVRTPVLCDCGKVH